MIYLSVIGTSVLGLFIYFLQTDPQIKTPVGYALLAFWWVVLSIQLICTFAVLIK